MNKAQFLPCFPLVMNTEIYYVKLILLADMLLKSGACWHAIFISKKLTHSKRPPLATFKWVSSFYNKYHLIAFAVLFPTGVKLVGVLGKNCKKCPTPYLKTVYVLFHILPPFLKLICTKRNVSF